MFMDDTPWSMMTATRDIHAVGFHGIVIFILCLTSPFIVCNRGQQILTSLCLFLRYGGITHMFCPRGVFRRFETQKSKKL